MKKKVSQKEVYEPLLLEWLRYTKRSSDEQTWFGQVITKYDRRFADNWENGVKGLQETTDKYYYLPGSNGRIRVSYYEKGLPA